MRTDSVSVVIPFYGDPAPTLALLDSFLHNRSPRLHEVIVSDDASPTPFPQREGVTVIRRQQNGGFAQAVNSGVDHAHGDLLLILNSDLELHPGFLDDLLTKAEPWMPAVATTALTTSDGTTSWSGRHFPSTWHYLTEWLTPLARLRHLPRLHDAVGHDTMADGMHDEVCDWSVGALMLLPLSAYRAVGGMDESFYMNSEEVDLQRRLRCLGVPSVVLGGLAVSHEGGGSSVGTNRTAWMVDGRRRYERKWNGMPGLWWMEAAMLTATGVNLLWNCGRRLTGAHVHPLAQAHQEATIIHDPTRWVPETNRARRKT